jgi:lysophospholipase L1-like esterase
MGNQDVFYRFDPVLGWDNLAGSHGQFSRSEFSYPVRINSSGMRDEEIAARRPGEFRIAVLGDSFVWGVGVADGERFTERLEAKDPALNVLNFGVTGFSPVQYLLQLDKVLALKPDFVIAALCLGNDLSDNVSYTPYDHPKPYAALTADGAGFELKGYPLPDSKPAASYLTGAVSSLRIVGLVEYLIDHATKPSDQGALGIEPAMLYVPLDQLRARGRAQVEAAFKLNRLLLAAMKTKIDAALGPHRFAVLLVPTKFELGLADHWAHFDPDAVARRVSADLSGLGIPVIDGREVIAAADFWKRDGHWRPSGHEKIAGLLAKFLAGLGDPRLQGMNPG